MLEAVLDFLMKDIVEFETYGINILEIILIAPVLFIDFTFLKILSRIIRKRDLSQKGYIKTVSRVIKWIVHFLACIAVIRILGVKIQNIFDFIGAVLNFKLFTIGDTQISLITIVVMIIVVWASTKLAKFLRNYFSETVFKRFNIEEGLRFSLSKIIGYLIIAIGIFVALQGLGIKLSALAVFAGFLGVGIGFGLQNIVANIVSGMVILFERPIKEGDLVRLQALDTVGEVQKITLRATVIRTIFNEHIIIPNNDFINAAVENMSYGDLKLRVKVAVGVAYGTDPRLVEEALIEAAHKTDNILDFPEPVVWFKNFGNSSLDFELLVWVDEPKKRFKAESDLHYEIADEFKARKITIPFPQRDVWIKQTSQ
jgi:small-conductance mechanosensitive channel